MPHSHATKIYDQFGAVIRTMHVIDDNTFVTGLHVDCEPIIEQAKTLRENTNFSRKDEIFRHAAKVPVHVAERAFREGWFHDDKEWRKWMNNPENREFRVWEGRV